MFFQEILSYKQIFSEEIPWVISTFPSELSVILIHNLVGGYIKSNSLSHAEIQFESFKMVTSNICFFNLFMEWVLSASNLFNQTLTKLFFYKNLNLTVIRSQCFFSLSFISPILKYFPFWINKYSSSVLVFLIVDSREFVISSVERYFSSHDVSPIVLLRSNEECVIQFGIKSKAELIRPFSWAAPSRPFPTQLVNNHKLHQIMSIQ